MKLQIALDDISLKDAISLIEKVKNSVDIVEVGTPFIIQDGMLPVKELKQRFPHLEILADTKIMDAGEYETQLAFDAGADYVTVLGVTDILTIQGCVKVAKQFRKQVVVDMICVTDLKQRIRELEDAGVTALAVHTGVDQQAAGRTPLDDLKIMKKYSKQSQIFVAGGINRTTLPSYIEHGADIAIVGGGISKANDPVKEAQALYNLITHPK